MQTNTNNVNKTWALLQTTGGKDEPVVDSVEGGIGGFNPTYPII